MSKFSQISDSHCINDWKQKLLVAPNPRSGIKNNISREHNLVIGRYCSALTLETAYMFLKTIKILG